MIQVAFTLTKDDLATFITYIGWDAPFNLNKRRQYYLKQIVPLLVMTALIVYLKGNLSFFNTYIYIGLAFVAFTTVVNLLNVRNGIKKQALKIAEDEANNSYYDPINITASETGIHFQQIRMESRFGWEAFVRKLETNLHIYLFYRSQQAIIIPKKAFRNADEEAAFRRLLLEKLPLQAEVNQQNIVENE